jgi:hypothetical protein
MPGIISTCLICCAAVVIFFIVLVIYAVARGGMFFRVGNIRARPYGRGDYGRETDERTKKLDAIRGNEKVLCEKCGEWADAGDGFCKKCGAPLEKR